MATIKQPKMLKEFLGDTPNNYDSSSNGFNSYPRNVPECYYSDPNFQNLLQQATTVHHHHNNNNNNGLQRSRSRSRAAAEAAMSSFQKLLNAVKSIHYSSTPSPSPLPRSLSRRFLGKWQTNKKRKSNNDDNQNSSALLSSNNEVVSSKIVVVTVKVKDILRWRSFRDLVADHPHHHHDNHQVSEDEENESEPSDLVGPTEEDAPSTSTTCDFTVTEGMEKLPCYYGNNEEEGKNWEEVIVASDSEVGPKEVEDYHKIGSEEGTEQQSPVSVLNSPFRDEVSDEENLSSFDQSLANMERTKQRLLQSIQLFESLAGVYDDDDDDDDETEVTEEEQPREEDDTIKAKRKDYVSRKFRWFEKGGEGLKDKKECMQGMEKQGQWSKFEEERSEVGVEFEFAIMDDLLDEVLFDLCG